MYKNNLLGNLVLFLVMGLILGFWYSACFAADETLTITTYYPSPYGSYNQLTTTGDTYLATTSANKVGIGTTSPAEKLEVSGNIKLSGASATYKITNVLDPTANQDVATKYYVDSAGSSYVVVPILIYYNQTCPNNRCPPGWTLESTWNDMDANGFRCITGQYYVPDTYYSSCNFFCYNLCRK